MLTGQFIQTKNMRQDTVCQCQQSGVNPLVDVEQCASFHSQLSCFIFIYPLKAWTFSDCTYFLNCTETVPFILCSVSPQLWSQLEKLKILQQNSSLFTLLIDTLQTVHIIYLRWSVLLGTEPSEANT